MDTVVAASDIDVAALRRFLDGPNGHIRDQVREMLERPEFVGPVEQPDRTTYRDQVLEWMRAIAREGHTALGFPPSVGGKGDVAAFVTAFETMAYGDLSLLVKVGVHFGLFGGAIQHLGTEIHHEKYLPDVITVDLPGCFGMSEVGHGSDVQSLRTTATYDAATQEFVVHTPDPDARKEWIGNAARHGRMSSVFCQLVVGGESHGVHCVLVPLRDEAGQTLPGVTIEDDGPKLGLNGVDNGRISFDQVRVPRENLLDKFASVSPDGVYSSAIENPNRRFFTMLGTLVQGRVSVAGAGNSAAKVALATAIRYADRRAQFGPPGGDNETLLLDYRTHQRRLMIPLAATYAYHFAQERLVADFHGVFTAPDEADEQARRRLESSAAGIKALATWHATHTIQVCREACGGQGYLRHNRFADLKADTDVFTTFEGDNTVLLQLVAKGLLTDFKDSFGELDPLGMVGFVASTAVETLIERIFARQIVEAVADALPVVGRDEDREMLDRRYQLGMLKYRERHCTEGAARHMKSAMDELKDGYQVFLQAQDHVVDLGRVHVERLVAQAFADAVNRCADPMQQALLSKVCDLHCLAVIDADRAWFMEHGRMSGPRAKALRRVINGLCLELRPHAVPLVDAFGVPPSRLGVIGR